MRYQFHPEALRERHESATFYEAQQNALGLRFIAAVQSAVDRIVTSPEAWRVMDVDVRRFLTKVFPYAVLYTIEKDYILIVAVMHCHREPGYWHHRI
ncbi:MAG TPA: type II toxin-antitoxin system RelE/ParE family toxin [Gallionella sp.]|nr:type II toxin-antitoxin system RelE/ParE family toxin [Gallionella sp.]